MNSRLLWIVILALGIFLLLAVVLGAQARQKPLGKPTRAKRRKITDDPTEEDCDRACQHVLDHPGLGVDMCSQRGCRDSSVFGPYCACMDEVYACGASKTAVAAETTTASQQLATCLATSATFPTIAECQAAVTVTDMCQVTTGVLPGAFTSFLVVYRSGASTIIFNTAEVDGTEVKNSQESNWEDVEPNAQQWNFTRVMKDGEEYWTITSLSTWPLSMSVGTSSEKKVLLSTPTASGTIPPDYQLWKFSTNSQGHVPQITNKSALFDGKYLEQNTGNWEMASNPTDHPFNFFPALIYGQCTGSVLSYKTARKVSGARRAIGDPIGECNEDLAVCNAELQGLEDARDVVLSNLQACQDGLAVPITAAMCQAKHTNVSDMCVFSQSLPSKDFTGRLYTVWNSQSVIKVAGWYAEDNRHLMISAQNRTNTDMRLLYFTHLGGNQYYIRLAPTTHYLKGSTDEDQPPFFQVDLGGGTALEWEITGDNWQLTIKNVNSGFYLYKEQKSEGNYPIDYGPTRNSAFNGWSLNNVLTDFGCDPSLPRYKT